MPLRGLVMKRKHFIAKRVKLKLIFIALKLMRKGPSLQGFLTIGFFIRDHNYN